jgi:hypothetical protein
MGRRAVTRLLIVLAVALAVFTAACAVASLH